MVDWNVKPKKNDSTLIDMKSLYDVQMARQFEDQAILPYSWKLEAIELWYVAEELYRAYEAANKREWARMAEAQSGSHTMEGQELLDWYDTRAGSVYLLLVGYAIENLIKGTIYVKTPSLLEEDDKNLWLKRSLANHELANLYVQAGLAASKDTIDHDTKDILDYLEEFITWRGRYGIPLNLQQLKNAKPLPSCISHGGDIRSDKINELIKGLITELDKLPIPPTHSYRRFASK